MTFGRVAFSERFFNFAASPNVEPVSTVARGGAPSFAIFTAGLAAAVAGSAAPAASASSNSPPWCGRARSDARIKGIPSP